MELEYQEFLKRKIKAHVKSGFEIDENKLNGHLFPFQKFIVKKALRAGKYAVFAECGLGKGQPYGSKVLSLDGWINIEDLNIGDMICSSDGKFYPVTGVYPKTEIDTYRFHFSDGVSHVFDVDHLHIVRTNNDRQRKHPWSVISTRDMLNKNIRFQNKNF